ncbi:3-hydroxyacyl-ACP dehydratase [Aquimarina sp. 2201CG14-23]|uniref:3-hydroxyacyl-ACP dehydratase n=1 Tax=Aquimarina mycalae TaxID=3040073 RepID=UPI0024781881|nr:3-hydroxyacyl-ACP dehydratase [Aquimarina sp. 2201CG14-23]MDH7446733.1 3-hydroxyacyl-ACP dehydratase [Aquimarina sp. 2201CG14-23]
MLIADLYKINEDTVRDGVQTTSITLNPDNEVFKGHFPGNPVTPGVCMLQIIKELTENRVGRSLFLKKASNVKFMAVINPEKTPDLIITNDFTDSEDEIKVKNTFKYDDTIALKVVVTFIKI